MSTTIIVPVPRLAPGVTLLGPLRDAAFQDQQWLVQRGERFIQLTELLYRILEHADGRRAVDDIAVSVTEGSEWLITPDVVEALISVKLMPLGLIEYGRDDANAIAASVASTAPAVRSPLAVQMRMKMIDARVIAPMTRALQVLFAPVLLVPLLIGCAMVHAWAYRSHDLAQSVAATLYTPGGLLLALAVLLVGALFHELGHAAALRYGGGQVRGIGAGLYLIFPAFYTDVTDAYRLGRAARVRTDLGGVYFHLLFASALMLASSALGNPLLMFAAMLVNLEIARQFIPFVRLDGYWLLADLTGVPDLFSQMRPFLRSILPRRHGHGQALPTLRPFAKAVFIVYIALTVPVLVYLFGLMLVKAPVLFLAARDAFTAHVGLVLANDNLSMSLLAISQMLLVAVPAIGTVLIVVAVMAIPLAPLAAALSPRTRSIAGHVAFATSCGLVLVWLAQGSATSATPALSEPDSAIAAARTAIGGMHSLTADVEGVVGADRFTGTVHLKRPNLAKIEILGSEGLGRFQVISDGRELFVYFPGENQYSRMPPGHDGRHITAFVVAQVQYFFNPARLGQMAPGAAATLEADETLDGENYRVLRVTTPPARSTRYFLSRRDGLVHRVAYEGSGDRQDFVQLRNVRGNAELVDALFAWTLPAGAATLQMPISIDGGGAGGIKR